MSPTATMRSVVRTSQGKSPLCADDDCADSCGSVATSASTSAQTMATNTLRSGILAKVFTTTI